MKVLFVQNFCFEYIGVSYLSAALKAKGMATDVLIEKKPSKVIDYVRSHKPDVVAMPVITGYEAFYRRVCALAREVSKHLVMVVGGPHVTFFPEFVRSPGVTFGVKGEADTAFPHALAHLDALEDLPNIITADKPHCELAPLVADLDQLPVPDRDLYLDRYPFLSAMPNKHFVTGRGCPFGCAFCFNVSLKEMYKGKGPFVRRLSPRRVIEEITQVRKQHALSAVRFDDDVFVLHKQWLRDFLPLYARRVGLPFSCLIRAGYVDDDLAALLKESGCRFVQFGVESGDPRLRNEVLQKGVADKDIVHTAAVLHRQGLAFGTFNMLNIPGETLRQGYATLALNQRIATDLPWCSVIQPYPNTRLGDYAVAHGFMDAEKERIQGSYFNRGPMWNRDSRKLQRLQKLFFLACKLNWSYKTVAFLVSLPLDVFFRLVFFLTFGFRYMKTYRLNLWQLIKLGLKTRGNF